MEKIEKHEELKESILDFVNAHLIGPMHGDNEVLEGEHILRNCYVSGVLYPLEIESTIKDPSCVSNPFVDTQSTVEQELSADDDAIPSEESTAEDAKNEVASDKIIFPSSAGLSIRCRSNLEYLSVNISFGTYLLNPSLGGTGQCYIRSPFSWSGKINSLESGAVYIIDKWVRLSWHVRKEKSFNVVSIILENRVRPEFFPDINNRKKGIFKSVGSIWQTRLEIFTPDGGDILRVSPEIRESGDHEINASTLLYRDCHPYASGHNCSVDWEEFGDGVKVWTTFFPRYDLYQMIPSVIDDVDFSIENFTDSKKFNEKGLLFFKILVERYSQWIADSRKRADGLDDLYKGIARKNLNNCQRAVERMEQGVVLLGTNASAQNCFIKANQVMSLQHEWKKTGKIFRWHPFQIAFFLLNLQGLFDELSNDRKIADLLWFPTGGGKTEAYLLISAFSFLWRRERESLKQRWGGGTAIILRYTLRLLTQQQLQRAARMCCAAEFLRKADPATRGHSPISIGFWVGGDSFPNDNKKWEKMRIEGCAPMPLSSCPCCNSELAIANYRVRSVGGEINGNKVTRLSITCFEESCAFSKQQLPIYLTDEDLFRFSPTMVIGTVDKFANVAWSTKSGKLFNKYHLQCNIHGMFHEAEEKCSCRLSPILSCAPELIIQDELHLITGPLGSMVGAFEVAIRSLCKNGLAEPKYIASTATIRGAGRQLMELYRKEGFQFPPSGLESGDSFFAKKANQNDRSKIRTYVGISAQGRSSKLIAARLYAAISHFYQHHRNKSTFNSADLDYFRTVVGYFNSRKELGGVNTMLGDDVLKWRKYQHDIDDSSYPNAPLDVEELFGGISSEKVMKVMARMEMRNHKAPEFVLATNILSVGIDINRLVTMVIAGQPKTTSEYVQASSRVGRERAGIVFINYNWARARDRSHYEKFRSYHEQLYRFVEGVSVTPFSPEVRRRTLAGTLVSMLRHNTPDMWGDFGAINIHRCLSDVQRVKEEYLENIQDINTKIEVGREIDQFFETWKKKTDRSTTDFKYRASAKNRGVLVPFGIEADNFIDYFVNSLRNVDDEIPLSKM